MCGQGARKSADTRDSATHTLLTHEGHPLTWGTVGLIAGRAQRGTSPWEPSAGEPSSAQLWGLRSGAGGGGAEEVATTGLLKGEGEHYQGTGEFSSHSSASGVIMLCC